MNIFHYGEGLPLGHGLVSLELDRRMRLDFCERYACHKNIQKKLISKLDSFRKVNTLSIKYKEKPATAVHSYGHLKMILRFMRLGAFGRFIL